MQPSNPEILTPRRSIGDNLTDIKDSLGEIASVERERVREAYSEGKERLKAAERRFEDYVREKPVRSLAVAAGLGALLGFLVGRRR